MKADNSLYEFHHDEAQLLADLSVVQLDLQKVLELLGPLRLGPAFANFTADMEEIHWVGAVIKYARIFPPGVLRWDHSVALDRLSVQSRTTHSKIMDIRNGYIAHSVGTWKIPCPLSK